MENIGKSLKKNLLIGLIGVTFAACVHKTNKTLFDSDKFSSWDASRIPLKKPYELLQLNGSDNWTMNFYQHPGSISNVKSVSVGKNFILLFSGETYYKSEKVKNAWFIVIPSDSTELSFSTKEEFDLKLKELSITSYKFFIVDSVYDAFVKRDSISWK